MNASVKTLLGAALISLSALSQASDFTTALSRHAQATAREIVSQWIEQRAAGSTWNHILRNQVPKDMDSFCGYRSLVGLPEVGFDRARLETEPVVGNLLESTFGKVLSRSSAKLSLAGTSTKGLGNENQALVTLQVIPARPGDPSLSLLLELSSSGDMSLCDIAPNADPSKGILSKLGTDLNL